MIKEKENKLLLIKNDQVFKDMFNENQMDTLEWMVMKILNAKYEDIHGKVKVENACLVNTYPEERNKTVDLLVNYNGDKILIELNNNYCGNYMRNLLYAFNIVLNHYNAGTKPREIVSNRCKVILVNLNWYPKNYNYKKVVHKEEILMPYPEDNTKDFVIKTININLDFYKEFCYDEISEWDKLWKLLTIDNEDDLKKFIANEKLLKQYQKQLFNLSKDKDYKEIVMNETIEQNALYEQTYGVGYRRGIEEGIQEGICQGIEQGIEQGIASNKKEMVINMYKEEISLETISKCTNLNLEEVNKIIENIVE